jgi:hypothetical protein
MKLLVWVVCFSVSAAITALPIVCVVAAINLPLVISRDVTAAGCQCGCGKIHCGCPVPCCRP